MTEIQCIVESGIKHHNLIYYLYIYRVIEHIINEQLDKLKSTLEDLQTLDSAEVTAVDRLHVVRTSMRISKVLLKYIMFYFC